MIVATVGVGFSLVTYFGIPVLVSAAVVGFLGLFSLRQWVSGRLAIAVSISSVLVVLLAVVRLSPYIGRDLEIVTVVALTGISILWGGLVASRPDDRIRFFPLRSVIVLAPALVVGVVAFVSSLALPAERLLAWSMSGDAVPDLMFGRYIAIDGGVDPFLHPHSSPLPYGLVALDLTSAAKAQSLSELGSLQSQIAVQASWWLAMLLLASVLAGVVVDSYFARRRALWAVCVLVGAAFPFSWYLLGFSIDYGFYNASVIVVILLVMWVAWREVPLRPWVAISVLLLVATLCLATWAPLVVFPAALASAAVVVHRSALWAAASRSQVTVFAFAVGLLVAYGILVTVRDVLADGSRLGVDAAFPTISPVTTLLVVALLALIALTAHARGDVSTTIGVTVLSGVGALALAYLVFQRRDAAQGLWGYYPQKFVWVIAILTVVIAFGAVAGSALQRGRSGSGRVLALSLAASLIAGTLLLAPSTGTGLAVATPIKRVLEGRSGAISPEVAAEIFALSASDVGRDVVVWNYRSPEADVKINYWLIQMAADTEYDVIRFFAYVPDMSPEAFCHLLGEYGSVPVVHTGSVAAADLLESTCPDLATDVVVMVSD